MRKIIAAVLALVMVLSLAACGGGKEGTTDETNKTDKADKAEETKVMVIGDYQVVYKGYSIVKDFDDMDALALTFDYTNKSGVENSFFWSIFLSVKQCGEELGTSYAESDGVSLSINYEQNIKSGETIEVTVVYQLLNTNDNVVVELSDSYETNRETITIELSGGQSSGQSDGSVTSGVTNTLTPEQEYWNGCWYGWLIVTGAGGDYTGWDNGNYWFDCCVDIELDENGEGSFIIWNEEESRYDPAAEINVVVVDNGTNVGSIQSVSGYYWDYEVGDDWYSDPEATEFENLTIIDGVYVDPADSNSWLEFYIHIRPWGMDWEDVAMENSNALPGYYYDWYLPGIQAGYSAPDYVGGEFTDFIG
ncbi:MAG: DUF5067 domain-containing protein [Oscillospiraceae bacterium]